MGHKLNTIVFKATGVTDAVDGTNAPMGSMAALTNLIPAPSTLDMWLCRPASNQMTVFTGPAFNAYVTALLVVGDVAYGLINKISGIYAGLDFPFAYNLLLNTFTTVSIANANLLATSPSNAGDWSPPIMCVVGNKIIVTHPGFPSASGGYFGWIDISTPSAPVWNAGNTSTNALPSVPTGVGQLNGRAYFLCGTSIPFSDSLNATVRTNASQALSPANGLACTAIGPISLASPLVGGVTQALIVFQGVGAIQMIQGDSSIAAGNAGALSLNAIKAGTGTLSPLSLTPLEGQIAFVAPDGVRTVNLSAEVSPPMGADGRGVSIPFRAAINPGRTCAALNGTVLRISVKNGASGQAVQEWWFHTDRKIWSGPHTFPAALIQPWATTFVMAANGIVSALWQSAASQDANSGFTENGTALTYTWTTSLTPDNERGTMNRMTNDTVLMALYPPTAIATITLLNEAGNTIDAVSQSANTAYTTVWGAFVWGGAPWGAFTSYLVQRRVNWNQPNVFKKAKVSISGNSLESLTLGNMSLKLEELDYVLPTF